MAKVPTLVIDADLNRRIATELKRRGRRAVALSELQLRHAKDPELLMSLAEYFGDEPWVLVTGDDNMPAVHPDVIQEVGATLGTVDAIGPVAGVDRRSARSGRATLAFHSLPT